MPGRPPVASFAVVSVVAALALPAAAFASDAGSRRPSDPLAALTPPLVHQYVAQPSLAPAVIGLALACALAEPSARTTGEPDPGTPLVRPVEADHQIAAPQPSPARPRGLVPLYASFAALQALDVHSTLTAVHGGGVEQNVVLAPMVSQPAAFVALKAGVTAGTIFAVDRLARHNRVAAYALMFALNSAYTFVVVHNYRVRP